MMLASNSIELPVQDLSDVYKKGYTLGIEAETNAIAEFKVSYL